MKKKPPVGRRNAPTIWDKVDIALLIEEETSNKANKPKPEKSPDEKKRLKRKIVALDLLASTAWIYSLVKVFIADLDRLAINAISPRLLPILDYRLFIYAALTAVLLVIGNRLKDKALLLATLYVIFFPVVILIWKIPRVVYRRKSWTLLFGMLNVLVSLFRSYKTLIPLYVLLIEAALIIQISTYRPLVVLSGACVVAVIGVLMWRTGRNSFQRSKFITLQRDVIVKIVNNLSSYVGLQPELRDPRIKKFNKVQLELFRDRMALGFCLTRATGFWMHQLNSYRKAGVTVLFGILSFSWLLLEVLLGGAFINMALVKVYPESFTLERPPSILTCIDYTLNALVVNGVEYMQPTGGLPLLFKIIFGLIGPFLALTLLVHLTLSYKPSRREVEFEESRRDVNRVVIALEAKLKRDYDLGGYNIVERIQALGGSFYVLILQFIAERIPHWEDELDVHSSAPQ
ncbi:hypothetical protein LCL61_09410 [Amycolatopsis coloradensis]|uniref:Uncharacterized protein n=1 Tax=Amycolatopsis coloradensis TaxID=76021 RepID=A0ACD5BDI1_9PSEU